MAGGHIKQKLVEIWKFTNYKRHFNIPLDGKNRLGGSEYNAISKFHLLNIENENLVFYQGYSFFTSMEELKIDHVLGHK